MECSFISPGIIQIICDTEEEAKVSAITMNGMLQLISSTKKVFLRRPVQIDIEKDFETDKDVIKVSCRFQVIEGEPGIFYSSHSYDNSNMIHGFGLSQSTPKRIVNS